MSPIKEKKILVEKPKRGREMLTRDIPESLIDAIGVSSAKKEVNKDENVQDLLTAEQGKSLKPYHEGFVGTHRYLVPDSDLEAMKTLIHFKSQRREGRRYLQEVEPETERETYQRYQEKYKRMYSKIHEVEEKEEEKVVEEEVEESEVEEESTTEEEDIEEEEKPENDIISVIEEKYYEETDRLRFLISGHIRKNMKPLFIVQMYEGKPYLHPKSLKLMSKGLVNNINIVVSGKYYKENILLEEDNKLKSLNIGNKEIIIDEFSRVYENTFSDIFSTGDIDVKLSGRFFQHQETKHYTPILSIKVDKKGTPQNRSTNTSKNTDQKIQINRNKYSGNFTTEVDIGQAKANETVMYMSTQNTTYPLSKHSVPISKMTNRTGNIRNRDNFSVSKTTDKEIIDHSILKSTKEFDKVSSFKNHPFSIYTNEHNYSEGYNPPIHKVSNAKRVTFLEPQSYPTEKNTNEVSINLIQNHSEKRRGHKPGEKPTKHKCLKVKRWVQCLLNKDCSIDAPTNYSQANKNLIETNTKIENFSIGSNQSPKLSSVTKHQYPNEQHIKKQHESQMAPNHAIRGVIDHPPLLTPQQYHLQLAKNEQQQAILS